ncbi:hypothetical protein [Oceanobacter mangrovi]|uniref:hypothetical protein n=1 Tax=Oceanobacter mangrovi TaxID=2862510 RepID=UPI001C8DB97F|nr:hypothetical protein [Oceanobacter mangrovi]
MTQIKRASAKKMNRNANLWQVNLRHAGAACRFFWHEYSIKIDNQSIQNHFDALTATGFDDQSFPS